MKFCTLCKTRYEDGISFCPADGEVLEEDPSSIVGTVLDGQYQIESLLGKGGMGAVFLARHILLGDRVAIKVLPPEMRNNAEWLRRFRREGQAARRFRHANAVTVYDLRTASDGTIYMVMEYVEGHTLYEELKARGHFSPADAVSALEPIMSVLNEAHAMGVVHRDLKPENIMFGKAGTGGAPQVKLLDLGIAKIREVAGAGDGGNTALTMAGQMLGTPYYMSPEQWGELPLDGNPEIDGRADIYSLGLVLYEMIAGNKPYSALTLLELRKEHVSVIARDLSEVAQDVPRSFSAVIARAIAKDRNDRPGTAGELAKELKAALAGAGTESANFVPSAKISRPPISSAQAPTVTIDKAALTASDGTAATVIGVESAPATETPVARVTQPFPKPEVVPAGETIAESASMAASSVTAPQQPGSIQVAAHPAPTAPIAAPPVVSAARGGSMSLVIGGVVILLVLGLGVGGFFLVKALRGNSAAGEIGNNRNTSVPPTTREVGRYWLEISAKPQPGPSVRAAPMVPVASGQFFKLHFTPTADGFVYIIGPGVENALTAFLTAKPPAESGLTSNEVKKGVDFVFPKDDYGWLGLDKKPGSEEYTLIYSPTPLSEPKFFSREATARPLNDTEKIELTAFFASHKSGALIVESNTDNAREPFVLVKAPLSFAAGNPLVFDIRIEHR